MRHPPEPHYSFTIPSIHDDTTLDCRIYHPAILSKPLTHDGDSEELCRRKGIVIAHPYAPMGGCYDDRVVGIVTEEFIELGYVVGTFNFRGAHGSKGRTSWSGKPELGDYISFAAFFMYYLSYIRQHPDPSTSFAPELSLVSPQISTESDDAKPRTTDAPIVILGGYSYGSLILQHLPPVPSILQPFNTPPEGSAASEILLRARKLSDQSNLEWINIAKDQARQKRNGPENKLSVTMGGEETSPGQRRSSREIRRSVDGGRSVDFMNRIRSLSHKRRTGSNPRTPSENYGYKTTIEMPEVQYLLISPLTPPISTLAAPGLSPKPWSKQAHQEVVGKHISLAVYGDQDIFTSSRKVKQWAEKLGSEPGSRFSHVEVPGAGHFWHEHGVEEKLRSSLKNWEVTIRT